MDADTDDENEGTLIIRPMKQFKGEERYIVILKNLKNAANEAIDAPEVFKTIRDNLITENEVVEARRISMNDLFDTIESSGTKREELYLVWDFTIASSENITQGAAHIKDDALPMPGNDAPSFEVTNVV